MYYILYKTMNLVNGKIYIGAHSTNNLDDGYLGSGIYLKEDIKKYGKQSFKREILKLCDSKEDLMNSESLVVNEEFVKRRDTYNYRLDNNGGWVLEKLGDKYKDMINGALEGSKKSLEYTKGKILCRDKNNNVLRVEGNDPRYLNGDIIPCGKGKIVVKDKMEQIYYVEKDDPRYLNGELVPLWKDRKHSQESRNKIGKANSVHQKGSGNSQYGTC
ncbi:MAG: GIY-YIG nuclease family protein [archaeon]